MCLQQCLQLFVVPSTHGLVTDRRTLENAFGYLSVDSFPLLPKGKGGAYLCCAQCERFACARGLLREVAIGGDHRNPLFRCAQPTRCPWLIRRVGKACRVSRGRPPKPHFPAALGLAAALGV
jgi:hypothetical protein